MKRTYIIADHMVNLFTDHLNSYRVTMGNTVKVCQTDSMILGNFVAFTLRTSKEQFLKSFAERWDQVKYEAENHTCMMSKMWNKINAA